MIQVQHILNLYFTSCPLTQSNCSDFHCFVSFYSKSTLFCGFEFYMQYFVNISWIIHTWVHHSHPLKFQSSAKLSFGVSPEWPPWYFCFDWLIDGLNMTVFTELKLDLENNVQSICFMMWYYIIITDGMRMCYRRDCGLTALLFFLVW